MSRPATPKPVVSISLDRLTESGKGHSWWVTLRNAAGQTLTPFRSYVEEEAHAMLETWQRRFGMAIGMRPTPVQTITVAHMTTPDHPDWSVILYFGNENGSHGVEDFATGDLDHALIHRDMWAAFLGLPTTPFLLNGTVVEASMDLHSYDDED